MRGEDLLYELEIEFNPQGTLAERMVLDEDGVVPVPDHLTDEEAVLVDPLSCSLHGVLLADLSQVRRVLVYGSGMLGLRKILSCKRVSPPPCPPLDDSTLMISKSRLKFSCQKIIKGFICF